MQVEFRILGPLEVLVDGVDVSPAAPKERALLALLIVRLGQITSADRLVDELWPALPPERARRALQVRIASLRKIYRDTGAPVALEFVPPGYRMTAVAPDVDEHRFSLLVDGARGQAELGDHVSAAALFREALGLWRGEPLADVQCCVTLEVEASRLDELRLGTIEDCIDAELATGTRGALVAELDALVAAHPLRERLWAQRSLALYRSGRQAEALRGCATIRHHLRDELGVEPGPALWSLETAMLEHRPELDGRSPISRLATGSSAPSLPPPLVRRRLDEMPPVRYAKTFDGVNLAYQVFGDGPIDLIIIPGYVTHLETWWEAYSGRLLRRLASFTRMVIFDKRGTGLSDRPEQVDVEHWMEDTRAVMDAVGSERAAILGVSAGGGTTAVVFAATYPERVHSLVIYGSFARALRDDDDPIGASPSFLERHIRAMEDGWGTGVGIDDYCPSVGHDPAARESFARFQRVAASPTAATRYLRAVCQVDVRPILATVTAPTLVLHASRDRMVPIEMGRYMAERLPNARLSELDSEDHLIWFSDVMDVMTDEIQDFLTGAAPTAEVGRVLATIVVVESGAGAEPTARAVEELVERYRGHVAGRVGEQVLATFDGPARAIRCAAAIVDLARSSGAPARAGLHCGECTIGGSDVDGLAVKLAGRVAGLARPGEVLVSQTVRDLVHGSAIAFEDHGVHAFEGAPGTWRVHAVTGT